MFLRKNGTKLRIGQVEKWGKQKGGHHVDDSTELYLRGLFLALASGEDMVFLLVDGDDDVGSQDEAF